MFEKEAEEIAKDTYIHHFDDEYKYPSVLQAIIVGVQKGTEFGYNKANEEMQEIGLALQSDMDKTIEQNIALKEELEKANEWHYVKDGDLPKGNDAVLIYWKFGEKKCASVVESYKVAKDKDVIAWKEIDLPELPKEIDV